MGEIWTLSNTFLYIGIFAAFFYIIKIILFFFGGDLDADFESAADTETAFSFISLQSVLAFLMGFGWCGLASLTEFKLNDTAAILAASACGLFCMLLSAYLMYSLKKAAKPVKIDWNELLNKTGRSYSAFKPHGKGQIEIDVNGKLSVVDAYNITEEEIPSFTEITAVKIENGTIYIEKKK